eukprot:38887-Pleurochrysis_carterae.AAC.1
MAPRGGVGERVGFAENVGNEKVVAEGLDGGGAQHCLEDVLHEGRLCGFSSEGVARGEGVDFRDDRCALGQVVLESKEGPLKGDELCYGDGDAQVLRGEWYGLGKPPEGPAHDPCKAC